MKLKKGAVNPTVALLCTMVLVNLVAYPYLPDVLPYHFDLDGNVSSEFSKMWVLLCFIAITFSLSFLTKIFIRKSPRDFQAVGSDRAIDGVVFGVLLAIFVGNLAVLSYGYFGSTLVVLSLGNLSLAVFSLQAARWFSHIKVNFFVGIRTPWTLSNDDNWLATHRFCSKCLFLGALLDIVFSLLHMNLIYAMLALLAGLVTPVLYSYAKYRQMKVD